MTLLCASTSLRLYRFRIKLERMESITVHYHFQVPLKDFDFQREECKVTRYLAIVCNSK